VGGRQGVGDSGADPATGAGDECGPHACQLKGDRKRGGAGRSGSPRRLSAARNYDVWSPLVWAVAVLPTGSLPANRSSGASALQRVSWSFSLRWLSSVASA